MDPVNSYDGHVVTSLDKALYDDYLCVVTLNKQQIYVGISQTELNFIYLFFLSKNILIDLLLQFIYFVTCYR